MRIALFALTGFGNVVLPALCLAGRKPQILITRTETGPFPYYPIPHVSEVAAKYAVPCAVDGGGEDGAFGCDLILAATYHRVLPMTLCRSAKYAVNLHPSLLPRYRGPTPFYWVLRNGERETGITAHELSDQADAGDIFGQWRLLILPQEDEASLRKRLAELAARAAVEIVDQVARGDLMRTPQDERQATYFPRADAV